MLIEAKDRQKSGLGSSKGKKADCLEPWLRGGPWEQIEDSQPMQLIPVNQRTTLFVPIVG